MIALRSGVGLGWRPETAWLLDRRADLALSEVVVERNPTPERAHERLLARGTAIVPHGVSLGLGDAARPDPARLRRLAAAARAFESPFVSEHVAFVRGGGRESGHLLPVPRTREALAVLAENVRIAQDALPVPLAVENIAAPLGWPDDAIDDADFLAELVDRTGVRLVLDVANLHANARNRGVDPEGFLDRLPLASVAYLHIAGGHQCGRWYHDTHAHPVPADPLALLASVRARGVSAPVLLERDRAFPTLAEIEAELDAIARSHAASPLEPAPARRPSVEPATGRGALAYRQAALMERLVGKGADPPGFDREALEVTARTLGEKAARARGSRIGPLLASTR